MHEKFPGQGRLDYLLFLSSNYDEMRSYQIQVTNGTQQYISGSWKWNILMRQF